MDNLNIAQLRVVNHLQPVSSLPIELLRYIFELACRENVPSAMWSKIKVSKMRRTRSAINSTCFWWREVVALSTPILWRAITIMGEHDVRKDPSTCQSYRAHQVPAPRRPTESVSEIICSLCYIVARQSYQPISVCRLCPKCLPPPIGRC